MNSERDGTPDRARELRAAAESALRSRADDWPFADGSVEVGEEFLAFDFLETYPEVSGTWVTEPFAYVSVVRDEAEDRYRYCVAEPSLDEFERHVRQDLRAALRDVLIDVDVDAVEQGRERLRERVASLLAEEARAVPIETRWKIFYRFDREFAGYGALDPFMNDLAIEDISIDGSDVPAFVYHRDHGNLETNRSFGGDELDSLVQRLAQRTGRHVSAATPLLTDTLPDGSRVQLTLGSDVGARGSNLTVRKFRERPFTPPELASLGTFSVPQLAYLWLLVEQNRSVLFIGPTASGKTTSMNVATMFIPPDHKVVTIEETREVNLPHENWIADVTRESAMGEEREVGMYHFLSEALHQRPDHLIVGEIRTDPRVVSTFFQAMATGHAGFSTFHAESPHDALRRLRHDPLSLPNELVTDLDVISVQHQLEVDGQTTRRCRGLVEVREDETGQPRLHEVFDYDPYEDTIEQTGDSKLLGEIAESRGWTDEAVQEKLARRERVLATLAERETFDYETVTNTLFRFARRPDRVLEELGEPAVTTEGIDLE